MRLLIVGAGSTGGYFGARLTAAGRDVTFLVRPVRAALLKERGLRVVGLAGEKELVVQPKVILPGAIPGPFDAVLLAVKALSLESLDVALADLAPAVGAGTAILPVLNGMRHIHRLEARFGKEAVAGCVCKVATTLDAEGRIVRLAPFHELAYGERAGGMSGRMERLDGFLQGAGFDARLSSDIEREMWEKWILLAALGGLTCLLGGTVGEIEATPGGADVARRFLDEAVALVGRVGRSPSGAFVAAARTTLTAKGSSQTSSLYRDLQAGRPLEADQILGDLVGRARGAGVPVPLLEAACVRLGVHEARRVG